MGLVILAGGIMLCACGHPVIGVLLISIVLFG